jgi:GDSL-like lipase/acylhydrolase family protein
MKLKLFFTKLPSIFILGDSISIGYSRYLCEYLKGKFRCSRKKGLKEFLWNSETQRGANGGDSSFVLNYLCNNHKHKEILKVDYFLFNCGLHDIKADFILKKKQISLSNYKKNLCLILKEVNKFSKHIIWVNSTPIDDTKHNNGKNKYFFRYNKNLIEYNNVAKKIMEKNNIPIIDLYSFTKKCGDNIYIDHVHLKKRIYKKQGKYIAKFLLEQDRLNTT